MVPWNQICRHYCLPSFSCCFFWVVGEGCGGSILRYPWLQTLAHSAGYLDIFPSAVLGLPHGLRLLGCSCKSSLGSHPDSILIRCPCHISWFLSIQRSCSSILRSHKVSEHLTMWWTVTQGALWRNLVLTAHTHICSYGHKLQMATIMDIDWLVNHDLTPALLLTSSAC